VGGMALKKIVACLVGAILLPLCLSGCGGPPAPEAEENKVVIYCSHPLSFVTPLVEEFEQESGVKVEVVAEGTGALLQRLESEQEQPQADIFWGGSLSTVKPKAALFAEYRSAHEGQLQEGFRNVEGSITRFTDIPSVIMVNTDLIGDLQVEGYEDLLNPALRGKIAMADPAQSSSAYEHLINMLYAMGAGEPEQGWGYVEKLVQNLDGRLLASSAEVYLGVADGEFALGLTFEEGGARYALAGAPVKLVYMKEGVISKPDSICIVRQARHREKAEKFLDFITGKEAQTFIARRLHRRSVREDVAAPAGLLPKEEIRFLTDEEEVVSGCKKAWLDRFAAILSRGQEGLHF